VTYPRGVLCLNDWSGYCEQPVAIVDETPKRYRVTPAGTEAVKLSGRSRWLSPGETALVPKAAVKLEQT
jgi:hypothetical protein